jgi:hypothetical protein
MEATATAMRAASRAIPSDDSAPHKSSAPDKWEEDHDIVSEDMSLNTAARARAGGLLRTSPRLVLNRRTESGHLYKHSH